MSKETQWIREQNLEPVCRILAGFSGYDFSELDWDAIRLGVQDTSTAQDSWFDYTFVGQHEFHLQIAYDEPGSSVIVMKCHAPSERLSIEAETVMRIGARWTMTP